MRLILVLAPAVVAIVPQTSWAQRGPAPRRDAAQSAPRSSQPAVPVDHDDGYDYDPYAYGLPPIDYLPPPSPAGPSYRGGHAVVGMSDRLGSVSTVTVGGTSSLVDAGGRLRRGDAPDATVTSFATGTGFDPAPIRPRAGTRIQRRRLPGRHAR